MADLVRETLSGAPLQPAPIPRDWIERGDPQARLAILAHSDDCTTTTIHWECTAGRFIWRYDVDETLYFLEGEALISVAGQPARRYGAGDVVHFSRGAVASWTVESYVRKVAFCRR